MEFINFQRDFFTKTWGESFVEVREIDTHIALPDINVRHFEHYVKRLRKRQRLLRKMSTKEGAKHEMTSPNRVTGGKLKKICTLSFYYFSRLLISVNKVIILATYNLLRTRMFAHFRSTCR